MTVREFEEDFRAICPGCGTVVMMDGRLNADEETFGKFQKA
jgi:hypothetical protein